MAEGRAPTKTDKLDMLQTPYVKVATREIALLVKEVQNSQRERKVLREKCHHLENYISEINSVGSQNWTSSKVPKSPPLGEIPHQNEFKMERPVLNPPKIDSELEEDCDSSILESSNSVDKTNVVFIPPQDITERALIFRYDNIPNKSINRPKTPSVQSSDVTSHTVFPKQNHTIDSPLTNVHIGVSKSYFDMALTELSKSKRAHAELLKNTENDSSRGTLMLENKTLEMEKEKYKLECEIENLKKDTNISYKEDVICLLKQKVSQLDKQSTVRNIAFEYLNKQCDRWREKYEELMSEQLTVRDTNLNQTIDIEKQTCAPINMNEININSTPIFSQLLNTEKSTRQAIGPESLFKETSRSREPTTTSLTTPNPIITMLDNMKYQTKEASTQAVFIGADKHIQTDDVLNNNISDESTQTDVRIHSEKTNSESEELIFGLTIQNDTLNHQYECMRAENEKLNASLSMKEDKSVARELADRMKQLNQKLFSVSMDRDCLQKQVAGQSPASIASNSNTDEDTGIYYLSFPSKSDESELRKTLKLSSSEPKYKQSVLSDLILGRDSIHDTTEHIQTEFRSCPIISRFTCSHCLRDDFVK